MAVKKLGKVPAGKSKPVPKGARIILIHQRAHSNQLATRKGRVREGTSKHDAEKVLLSLAKSRRHTALLVDGKGKIILSAKGGKRGGKTKTSAKIAKIAATTKGKVQQPKVRYSFFADGATVRWFTQNQPPSPQSLRGNRCLTGPTFLSQEVIVI